MRTAKITSRCECQAHLEATLDERRFVLGGVATRAGGDRERAPAHTVGAGHARFDVGFRCPFCGRNALRSFDAAGLVFVDASAADAG